jgi:AcrR family transcriptional regulator
MFDPRAHVLSCRPLVNKYTPSTEMSHTPAYTRLNVDERRRRLLELGARLFTERAYDELSMARIAREAGISKALLYHYFPSKSDYFAATLSEKAAELAGRMEGVEDLESGLDRFLGWVEENKAGYAKLVRSAGIPEASTLMTQIRDATAARIVETLNVPRTAARAWLWFLDGAILDWIEHDDITRDEVRAIALGAFAGAASP